MKIVHIGSYSRYPLEGVGKTILEQTRALAAAGHDVEIWNICVDVDKPEKVDVGEDFPLWKLPVETTRLNQILHLPAVTRQWMENRKDEVRVFHLHSVFTAHNCHVAKLGVPYVVTPNGGWSKIVLRGRRSLLKKFWILLFEQKLWSRAYAIQAVSKAEAEYLQEFRGIAPVKYIPNGTHLPDKTTEEKSRGDLLFIGRYGINQKGLDVLLKALKILRHERKASFHMVFAGPDYRGGMDFVRDYIRENDLEECVDVLGPVKGEEKEALFRKAKLFIHTSRWEGMPLVLLEALSYGIPCLLTPGTNVADEWEEANCGFKVDFDPNAVAMKLDGLIKHDLDDQANSAREYVAREYSWSAIAEQLLRFYPGESKSSYRK